MFTIATLPLLHCILFLFLPSLTHSFPCEFSGQSPTLGTTTSYILTPGSTCSMVSQAIITGEGTTMNISSNTSATERVNEWHVFFKSKMGKSNVFSTFEENANKTTKHVQEGFEDLTDPYFIENVPTGLMKENVLLQICVWCDGSGGPSTCDEFVSLNRVFPKNNHHPSYYNIIDQKLTMLILYHIFFVLWAAPQPSNHALLSVGHTSRLAIHGQCHDYKRTPYQQ